MQNMHKLHMSMLHLCNCGDRAGAWADQSSILHHEVVHEANPLLEAWISSTWPWFLVGFESGNSSKILSFLVSVYDNFIDFSTSWLNSLNSDQLDTDIS